VDDPYAELARVKARIAELERYATAAPPLEATIADHYSPTRPPVDRKTRDLRNAAHGWQPDDQMEQAIRNRDRDPGAYAAAMAAMHADGMSLALYERGRVASLALGTFTVPTPEGDAS
jgi:hypothetical protein